MPKIKNLAALAAAVEAARRYARSNPDKAARYLDQAAAFLDKQTKGKYSGQIRNVTGKVKSVAGLPGSARQGVVDATSPVTPANPGSTASSAPASMPPLSPKPSVSGTGTTTGDPHFPGSKDL